MYDSINRPVIQSVPTEARSILDLGCGAGGLGEILRRPAGRTVCGVTFDREESAIAQARLDRVVVADLNSFDPAELGRFDCVLCSHVLEHLHAPEQLLARIHACLSPTGVLVVALPNILFWKQRWKFLTGRFVYTTGGLMDNTHVRFYDWAGAGKLLTRSGYEMDTRTADGALPLSRWLGPGLAGRLDRWALGRFPGLFGWQFVFRCRPTANPSPGSS